MNEIKKFFKTPFMQMEIFHFAIIISILTTPILFFIFKKVVTTNFTIIGIETILILVGAYFEIWKITKDWNFILKMSVGAYILSFWAFLPGHNGGGYDFIENISLWPFYFLGFLIMLISFFLKHKVITKLSETMAMVLSTCMAYLIIDIINEGFFQLPIWLLIIIGIVLTFVIINAFVNIKLGRTFRFWLSIVCSLILIVLSLNYIQTIRNHGFNVNTDNFWDKINLAGEYFLLGTSSLYAGTNLMIILGFLPARSAVKQVGDPIERIEQLVKLHINRFSNKQSSISQSIIVFGICSIFFSLNITFDFVDRNFAIWLVVFITTTIQYYFSISRLQRAV